MPIKSAETHHIQRLLEDTKIESVNSPLSLILSARLILLAVSEDEGVGGANMDKLLRVSELRDELSTFWFCDIAGMSDVV